jgi:hypothetical protein
MAQKTTIANNMFTTKIHFDLEKKTKQLKLKNHCGNKLNFQLETYCNIKKNGNSSSKVRVPSLNKKKG